MGGRTPVKKVFSNSLESIKRKRIETDSCVYRYSKYRLKKPATTTREFWNLTQVGRYSHISSSKKVGDTNI